MGRRFVIVATVFALAVHANAKGAGELLKSWPMRAGNFAVDEAGGRIYASLPNQNSVAVIDTKTLNLIETVSIGLTPLGLALTPDRSRLYVCTSGENALAVLDTNSLTPLPSIALPTRPQDVEVGAGGRVYATPGSWDIGIMQIDGASGQFTTHFKLGVSTFGGGMVEVSPDRNRLYFANRGVSPATLAVFDISQPTAGLIYRNPHGELGSNGQDLAISNHGQWVSMACGSGNGPGYAISEISTVDFSILGDFPTGPYPREIIYGPDDSRAYTVSTSGRIDVWDTRTFLPLGPISTAGEAFELETDGSGRYLFAAFQNELRVYATGVPAPGTTGVCVLSLVWLRRRR